MPGALQGNCLVTADRPTAQQAVAHFERHRVGIATCKILSELRQGSGSSAGGGMGSEPPGTVGGLRPLADWVQPNPAVPGADALVAHMLHNWWLAPDRPAALAAAQQDRRGGGVAGAGSGQQQRRRNIVTLQVR